MLGCTVLRAAAHRARSGFGLFLLRRLGFLLAICGLLGLGALRAAAAAGAESSPSSITHRLTFDESQIAIHPAGTGGAADAIRVDYPGSVTAPAGAPDLPRVPLWIEIPAGMRAAAVRGTPAEIRDLKSAVVAKAPIAPRADGTIPEAVDEAAKLPDPKAWAELGAQGSFRGHWVASVLVTPVQWDEASGRLIAARAVDLEIELEPLLPAEAGAVVPRARIVREIEARFDQSAGQKIAGFVPLAPTESLAESAAGSGPAGPGPYQPTFRPTTDGSAVEYVIVTSQALAAEFQDLANWKTQKGAQAVVRTVEWIDQTYPNGVDRAERIRFFIRDAYQNWGTLFVLLGGDTDIVPPRYAQMLIFNGERIPSDYYYGCLEGNWNGDGDSRFGESLTSGGLGDEIDLLYDVNVGRAPVSTLAEAQAFVDKTIGYDKTPPIHPRYPASVAFMAERLFDDTHGADIAEQAFAVVPSFFLRRRLYEESGSYPGSLELTRQAAIDSMNHGFGILHHVGHGFRNTMSMGDGAISNPDADNLTNGPRNSVVFAINCSSASIDFNSIGERFVKNPNGGSISYLGTSRVSFVSPSIIYQNAWYAAVFQDSIRTLGPAVDVARLPLAPNALHDSAERWNLLATILLGDPEADVYTNAAVPMQVAHPASAALGSAPITVTVTAQGSPVVGATVTLWKLNDVYVRGTTGGAGTVQLPITATATGPLTITVHKTYYRTYASTVNVTSATTPYLYVNAITVDDDGSGLSSGDADGDADAGETIELRLTLRNGGSVAATSVQATLVEIDPENAIAVTPGAVTYGTINPGAQSLGTGAFLIDIAGSAPVAYQPVLVVNVTSTQGNWQDRIVLPIRRSYLEHYSHVVDDLPPRGDGDGVVEADETIHYRVTLKNTGQDRATGVAGTLAALLVSNQQPHPCVDVTDASSSFGTISPGGSVLGDRFEFSLDPGCNPATLLLRLTLTDALGPVETQFLDVLSPVATDSVTAFGSPTSIRLEWNRSESLDAKGYDVLRAPAPGGPFNRINEFTADGTAAYEDRNLTPLTRYYYQIVSRDSSYNASAPSLTISGTTNPPSMAGWPAELGQSTQSSVVLLDTEGGPDYELFTAADYVYGWHANGSEILDGDSDARTNGPYSPLGHDPVKGFSATTAIGDIDLDDDFEIVNVGWTADTVYVWDHQGNVADGWPKWIFEDFNWPSPVLFDLDNNGDLEVIVWAAKGGRLFAWHHDGTEILDGDQNPATDGVFFRVFGTSFNYSSPAVADIDGDGRGEIIVAVNLSSDDTGRIYALNHDGSVCTGWPFATGTMAAPSQVTSSPAVGDVDKNGTQEIVVVADRDAGLMYVLNANGTLRPGWPRSAPASSGLSRVASPALGDVNNDTFLDIVYPSSDGRLFVYNRDGAQLPGFPVVFATGVPEACQSTPSLADIDGDNFLEIVFGDETGKVHAYNHDGSLCAGFPIQTTGEVRSTPIIWDIDQDGTTDIAVTGWDMNVYVWELTGTFNPLRAPWPFFRHDVRNTGWMSTAPLVVAVDEPEAASVLPAVARLYPARPNPFNPATTIAFDVPGQGARPVAIGIYDVTGRLVRELLEAPVHPGHHALSWDGRGSNREVLAAGVYFLRVAIGDDVMTEKLSLVK
jgi:Peptidase family C25/FG-GAP-like repeat